MSWAEIILLIVSGLLVGFINTLAGGGTIITVSLLIFLGLPAGVANGTNRIAVIFQNLVAVWSFRKQKILDAHKGLLYSIPSVAGSLAGAFLASGQKDSVIEKSIAFVMLSMLFFLVADPKRWLRSKPELLQKKVSAFQYVIFFLIGLYGGFIHIGVGFFILAGLVLSAGYDLLHANAVKNLIVLAYSPFALLIFMLHDQVNYSYGLILSAGNVAGAWIASRYAVSWGSGFIRWVIIIIIFITVLHLLGVYDFQSLFQVLSGKAS